MLALKQIQRLFDKAEYEKARQELEVFLENDPKNIKARMLFGLTYNVLEDYQKSLECFRKVLEIDPNNTAAKEEIELVEDYLAYEKKQAEGLRQTAEGYIFKTGTFNIRMRIGWCAIIGLFAFFLIWGSSRFFAESDGRKFIILFGGIVVAVGFLRMLYDFIFNYVFEIIVGQNKIKIFTLLSSKEYSWSDIKEVIKEFKIGSGAGPNKQYLIINTTGKKYRFYLYDIAAPKELINKLKEHIKIKSIKTKGIIWI